MDLNLDTPQNYVSQDLGLGSKSSLQSAAPAEAVQPQGNPLAVSPRVAVPDSYGSGETSAVGMQKQEGIGRALANFFEGANTPAGEIPTSHRLRLAQRKADLDEAEYRLKVKNYEDTHAVLQDNLQKGNRQAIHEGMEFAANVKGNLAQMTPEQREKVLPIYSKMLGHFHSELAGIPELFHQNPAGMLGFDSAAQHPVYGPGLQRLAAGRPYAELIKDPEIAKYIDMHGRDTINLINTRLGQKNISKLAEGKVSQQEYETMFAEAMQDASFNGAKPVDYAFAKHALNTSYGEEIMAGIGVNTNKLTLTKAKKEKPEGGETMSAIKATEYRKLVAQSEDPTVPEPQRVEAKKQAGILLGTESKDQGDNPNNLRNQRFKAKAVEAGLSVSNLSEIEAIKHPAAKKLAMSLWNEASAEQDKLSAQAQLDVKMSAIADTSNYIDAKALRATGKVIPIRKVMSESELRTDKNNLKVSPEQRKLITELNVAIASSDDIFNTAEEAYAGDPSRMGLAAAEIALKAEESALNLPAKLLAKSTYPKLAEYVARREETLGKFARGVSGEVGVLTDQDVGRVRNIFPTAGDSKSIRAAKRKSLNALLDLNRRFQIEVLAGEMSPDEAAALKQTPAFRSATQGILGGAEGVGKQAEGAAKPSDVPRGESLLERMRKGQ